MKALTSNSVVAALLLMPLSLAGDDTGTQQLQVHADMTAPVPESKAIPSPALDDRTYNELRDNRDSARTYQLDSDSGRVRFGDGVHGRRLPHADREETDRTEYRHGAGRAGDVPASPSPSAPKPVPVPYPNIATENE